MYTKDIRRNCRFSQDYSDPAVFPKTRLSQVVAAILFLIASTGFVFPHAANASTAEEQSKAANTHVLDQIPEDANNAEWLSEADSIVRGMLTAPPARVTTKRATPTELTFDFEVGESPADGIIRIPLVIPRGTITSSILSLVQLDGVPTTDPLLLKNIKVTADELGYIRAYRIGLVRVEYNSRALSSAKVTGGTISLSFALPPQIKDLGAVRFWARNRVGIFRNLVSKVVANPLDIDRYITVPEGAIPRSIEPATPPPPDLKRSPFRVRIGIVDAGVYKISGADLESSGIPTNWIKPDFVHLFCEGEEVPTLFVRRSSSAPETTLQPEDVFLFYGKPNPTQYSATHVYWLVYDETHPRLKMPELASPQADSSCESASAYLTKYVLEEDKKVLTRNDQFLSILDYRWVWDELSSSKHFSTEFTLPYMVRTGKDVSGVLNLFVRSLAPNTSISLCLQVNGGTKHVFPITSEFDNNKTFTISDKELSDEKNTLEVWLESESRDLASATTKQNAEEKDVEVYLDNIELWYSKAYRISRFGEEIQSPYPLSRGPQTPVCMRYTVSVPPTDDDVYVLDVTNTSPLVLAARTIRRSPDTQLIEFSTTESQPRRYVITRATNAQPASFEIVPTSAQDLWTTSIRADYIIIAYPDFVAPMQSFAQRKEKRGHKVLLVDTRTVYDQFSHGNETPEAIKRFIDYAARYYEGSGTNPPASFVLLVGDATSAYKNEFRNNVINYVPSYTTTSSLTAGNRWASDQWYTCVMGKDDLSDVLLGRLSVNNARDLENILKKLEDYENIKEKTDWTSTIGFIADHTEFDAPTERIARLVPPSFSVVSLHLSDEPWEDNFYFPKELAETKKAKVSPHMTKKIRDLFNNGAALVWYFGHGSPNIWSTQRIWFGGDSENSDNLMLRNRDKLSIVFNMTCNSGAIDYPLPRWNVCISEDFMRVPNGGAIACYVPSGPGMVAFHEKLSRELVRALLAGRMEPLGAATTLASYNYLANENPQDLVRMFILLGDPAMNTVLSTNRGMFKKGLATSKDLCVTSWEFVKASGCDSSSRMATSTLVLKVENNSELPVRDATFSVYHRGQLIGKSSRACFLPHETRKVVVSLMGKSGILTPTISVKTYGEKEETQPSVTPPMILVFPDDQTSSALQFLSQTLNVSHSKSSEQPYAVISVEVTNAGKCFLAPVEVTLEETSATRAVVASTTIPVLACGERKEIQLTRAYAKEFPESERLLLRASGMCQTSSETLRATMEVVLGEIAMPDLVIPPGGIMPRKVPVVDGETVFFNVVVQNRGGGLARGVRVEGYDGVTTASPPLQSRVMKPFNQVDIPPHSQAVIPLRWDPFHNAGDHDLVFRVWCGSATAEKNIDNNERHIRLHVLTKYKLKPLSVSILPQTEEDKSARRLQIAVKVANEGESPAHGVRIIVYGDKKTRNKSDVLAEEFISEIPAKSVVERIVTYKLTDQDVGRQIEPWCEVFLKGSLQRIPWPE
jgi:hypothetical protein